jgi:uncharacterized membrane protein
MTLVAFVLALHLACAFSATLTFWITASAAKGGSVHRRTGRAFARLVYATAVSGGLLAATRLVAPGTGPPELVEAERHVSWFVLYVLLIIVTPVQHGLAVVAAGDEPPRVRSRVHAALTFGSMTGTLALLPAALLWQEWYYLIVAPLGLVIGLRNLAWASRTRATASEVRREHLTSLVTGGITLHTALLVFGMTRSLELQLTGALSLLPWTVPALVGAVVIGILRRRTAS